MKLLEFISWCKLKDIVASQNKVSYTYENGAQLYKVVIADDNHRASIVYYLKDAKAVLVESIFNENIYQSAGHTYTRLSLKKIQEFFIPNETT